MSSHPLHSTERRLILVFLSGAIIFLLTFEGAFLLTRNIQENQFQRTNFEREVFATNARPENPDRRGGNQGTRGAPGSAPNTNGRAPLGIGYITIDKDGNLLSNRLGGAGNALTTEDLLDRDLLLGLPSEQTILSGGLLLRKIPGDIPGETKIFIGRGGYSFEDMLRDIFRFLGMDVVILIPFWIGARFFIRSTLDPVRKNMDAMAHFINDAGHELKTPLAIVSGNLQFLRDTGKPDPESINASIMTIDTMTDSLDGLLELSKLQLPEKIESFPLEWCAHEIVQLHQSEIHAKRLKVSYSIGNAGKIRMDRKHFSILLTNLVRNAIRYNVEGGEIAIGFSKGVLTVRDTGIGMKSEDVAKIFDRFFRVDRSGRTAGFGIGLAIVDRIVKLYGWTVSVESELGK